MAERATPWWAEASLVAVHLAVVAGFARLYEDSSFAGPLVAVVLAAHALAAVCRRRRLGSAASVAVALMGGAVAISWALLGASTWWGVPTPATWSTATDALREAGDRFRVVVAPTEVLVGFQLATAVALWWAVWFADWTAFRLRATIEPVVPAAAIFVFCAVLGDGAAPVASAAVFGGAVLAFVVAQRAVGVGRAAAPAVLRGGAVVAVLSVAVGAVVAPLLPGADTEAVVGWRDRGEADPTRITISPMVELKRRLVEQTDVLAFEVRADQPSYWRLTSLDSFDGEIWTSSGEYGEAVGELESSTAIDTPTRPITQRFEIRALSTIWVPSAFEAREVTDTEAPLRWDDESATLIVESSSPTSDGLSYTVRSEAPTTDAEVLAAADAPSPRDLQRRYTRLPSDFPEVASTLARQVVERSGAAGRYESALALQDWFRTFDYSLDSPQGHGEDALVAFLEDRVGYCEQFAGAFAAMARSLGIPARVAVGFTPGDPDPQDPDRYRVRGRHAHAWPEVHFDGVGWVPFEPTPQRGIPGAERYTGVPAQQATVTGAPPTPSTQAQTTTTVATAGESTDDTAPADRTRTETAAASDPDRPSDGAGRGPWALAATVAVAAAAVGVWALRRRRRAQAAPALLGADRTWDQVAADLAREGHGSPRPSETPEEYARRIGGELGNRAEPLRALAGLVSRARWSPVPLGAAEQAELEALAARVQG